MPPKVFFYTSSTPSTAVQKTEISRLQQLLDVKKVEYDTVSEREKRKREREKDRKRFVNDLRCLSLDLDLLTTSRQPLPQPSFQSPLLPIATPTPDRPRHRRPGGQREDVGRGRRLQGDPSAARGRKSESRMKNVSPFFGGLFFSPSPPSDDDKGALSFFTHAFPLQMKRNQSLSPQFIGTFSTIQEMEDFGELDAALGRPKK